MLFNYFPFLGFAVAPYSPPIRETVLLGRAQAEMLLSSRVFGGAGFIAASSGEQGPAASAAVRRAQTRHGDYPEDSVRC
jgi:hypothetical protein